MMIIKFNIATIMRSTNKYQKNNDLLFKDVNRATSIKIMITQLEIESIYKYDPLRISMKFKMKRPRIAKKLLSLGRKKILPQLRKKENFKLGQEEIFKFGLTNEEIYESQKGNDYQKRMASKLKNKFQNMVTDYCLHKNGLTVKP